MSRPAVDATLLHALSKLAGFDLPMERCEALAPEFSTLFQAFDAFDAVDIAEAPPAHAYDPRWRDMP